MNQAKIFVCLTVILSSSCSGSRPLTVAFKSFTEQMILGEILGQHLERRLGKTVRRMNLQDTLLVHQALIQGEIDLYPEYTGTALTTVLKLPPSSDPAGVLARVKADYHSRWNIEWCEPFGFNNTFAMVIRGPQARRENMETLSDAAGYKPGWVLGVGYDFQQRPDGLAGLVKTYNLPVRGSPKAMDLGLLYKALEQGQVEMVAANATDGRLSVLDVKALRDDKGYFPPYQAAPVVRADALRKHPGLGEALKELGGKFSDATMQKLNYQVDGEHRPIREVAKHFLSLSFPVPAR